MERTFAEQIQATAAGQLLYAQAVRGHRRRRLASFLSGWLAPRFAAKAVR